MKPSDTVKDFAQRRCRPLPEGTPPIPVPEVEALLHGFTGWSLHQGSLRRSFVFPDYHRTIAFVNAVAWIAHQQDHHPELEVSYNRCGVSFNTHSIGGISENDFICAARVEELLD